MCARIVKNYDECKENVLKGIDTVADIVKVTVGPRGRNVLIREHMSPPIITNDGVTIAKAIELKDNEQDAAAQLIIQAANKTNVVAGDGTTTTTILAQEMIHNALEQIELSNKKGQGINVVQLQKEMIKASEEVSDYLKKMAIPIKDNEDIKRVAVVSSGSEETGEMIAEAFELAGDYGHVIVEDSKNGVNEITSIPGMKITNGIVHPILLNDRANRKTEMKDVSVLITTDKIDNIPSLFKILDESINSGRRLLIMCDGIESEPLNMLINNKIQGRISNLGIIELPGFGELREKLIEDICIATGAKLIGREYGTTLRTFDTSYLGELDEVTIGLDDTILKFKDVNSDGVDLLSVRKQRVNEIEQEMTETTDKEQYKRRISNLLSGISIIKVGGNSEVEVKDRKLRIEDAINSVQSAKEEGIVPGGGYSFIGAYNDLHSSEANVGELIVYSSMLQVTKQIAENSGVDGTEVITKCVEDKTGYNALTGEYEDLLHTGVINSVKVDRYSLLNAASVASTVITLGGLIVDENEKDQNVLQLQGTLPPMM